MKGRPQYKEYSMQIANPVVPVTFDLSDTRKFVLLTPSTEDLSSLYGALQLITDQVWKELVKQKEAIAQKQKEDAAKAKEVPVIEEMSEKNFQKAVKKGKVVKR